MKNAIRIRATTITEMMVVMLLITIVVLLSYSVFSFSGEQLVKENDKTWIENDIYFYLDEISHRYYVSDSVKTNAEQILFYENFTWDSLALKTDLIKNGLKGIDSIHVEIKKIEKSEKPHIEMIVHGQIEGLRILLP